MSTGYGGKNIVGQSKEFVSTNNTTIADFVHFEDLYFFGMDAHTGDASSLFDHDEQRQPDT